MMRFTLAIWWSLAMFWLLTGYLDAQSGPGKTAPSPPSWPSEITGYGQTIDEARKEAAIHLAREAAAYLEALRPPVVAWKPSPSFAEKHFLEPSGRQISDIVVEGLGPRKRWTFPVKPLDAKKLASWNQEAVRQERAYERLLLSAELALVAALLLAGTWAYCYLEERTKGRYTRWLQAASAVLLVVVAAGWWWVH